MIKFKCRKCGEELEAPLSLRGQSIICPVCKTKSKVPVIKIKTIAKDSNSTIQKISVIKAGNIFMRLWQNSPVAFRTAFLATLGVFTAILVGFFVYGHLFISVNDLDRCKTILAQQKLFPVGSNFGIFRGRQLNEYKFSPDANYETPKLSLWCEPDDTVVGVSASWFGTPEGFPPFRLFGDDFAAYLRNSNVCDGFKKIVGYTLYFHKNNAFTKAEDGINERFFDNHKKWRIQISRFKPLFPLYPPKDPKSSSELNEFYYHATAITW